MRNKLIVPEILLCAAAVLIPVILGGVFRLPEKPADSPSARTVIAEEFSQEGTFNAGKKTYSPETLAWSFRIPQPAVPEETSAPEPAAAEPEEKIIPGGNRIKLLGIIRDENATERLYLKDGQNGRLYKVRLDGTDENETRIIRHSPDAYIVNISGTLYSIKKE
ncbi:hypothetical protein K7I13_11265 [Brucepastera parasyntrophica]|uniref:hypothetical protein n=1 Tax=Brucepastera parasyntrophica TaxID=2880008 RepID=UPI00210CB515|nr:hypothetical protein [Brucepastera parasyntrophica]ULQ59082.1 hypothetical protein K7I13_11265 [Brucepastera parasyntrophica]